MVFVHEASNRMRMPFLTTFGHNTMETFNIVLAKKAFTVLAARQKQPIVAMVSASTVVNVFKH